MKYSFYLLSVLLVFFQFKCTRQTKAPSTLFEKLQSELTGIEFENKLTLEKDFDVFRYRNFYNGGGVAIGDVNNDGLNDIYLTSNMGTNKLFLNKGDFHFEDVTIKAGVGGRRVWSTGVSMVDVNGDGYLDIYVCNSGDVKGGDRENELFINNGDLTFKESANQYGLNDRGFGTHAVFFDYDQDGDLDCYVLNNSFRPVSSLGLENIRHIRDSTGADKLYRNDNDKFIDVSEQSGIYGSVIGFGLGVTITDVNLDTWPDIYVSNDFFERDYLYINQKDGTFKDELVNRMGHISHFSMGTDAADLNNDGAPEIFVTDMLPEKDARLKTMTHFDSYDRYQLLKQNDYYEQFMRNTLQLNDGNGNFTEIGQYAGVDATDWSWGALLADFDNDGVREIFVTNGIYKDVTNQDFIDFLASDEMMLPAMRSGKVNFQELVDKMPSVKLSNYLFKRDSTFRYKNVANAWGLDEPSFSNGAAYGDLDNDGDLDLVVNNVNMPVFVYRNTTNSNTRRSMQIALKGPNKNTKAIGARINLFNPGSIITHENVPTKGFQSSMSYYITLGCDTTSVIDSLEIFWGYGKYSKLYHVSVDTKLVLDIKDAVDFNSARTNVGSSLLKDLTGLIHPVFKHKEDDFVDFNRERLLYHMLSREGPSLAVADLNNDGLDDFYIGGAHKQQSKVYLQNGDGSFYSIPQTFIEADSLFEDVDAVFFDADNDGDQDLYVVSGGYLFPENSPLYVDRLYINEFDKKGKVNFIKASKHLPQIPIMGSCVKVGDYDNDGDLDLFVGARAVPGRYGISSDSFILENDGKGNFENVTNTVASRLYNLGMVNDAAWVDIDNDRDLDLVIVGDWMPISIFKNNGKNFEKLNNIPGLVKSEGWWNDIHAVDINSDGNMDFIIGNWGLNSKFRVTKDKPITLFVNDFDKNETTDPIFTYYEGDSLYPMPLRHELIAQISELKKKYLFYNDYASKTVDQIFGKAQLENSVKKSIYNLESSIVINNGDGSYSVTALPKEFQYSPIMSITALSDSKYLLAGNFYGGKPEVGRYDGNKGLILDFTQGHSPKELGLNGDIRNTAVLKTARGKLLLVARNNEIIGLYEL